MPIVERLQSIAKERGINFKQLEAVCGIGNGVIRRWDIQSPRLDRLVKVADYLNVSLDYLVYGKSSLEPVENSETGPSLDSVKKEQGLLCDGSPLKDEEADLIAMYRLLPSHVREDMFEQVYCLYRKYAERKKGSIYWTYSEDDRNKQSGPAEGRETRDGTA